MRPESPSVRLSSTVRPATSTVVITGQSEAVKVQVYRQAITDLTTCDTQE